MENRIRIEGDFTTENALKWKIKLNDLALKVDILTLDLTDVTVADIVGINALAITHKLIDDKSGVLKIKVKKTGNLYSLLCLTKFSSIFNLKLVD